MKREKASLAYSLVGLVLFSRQLLARSTGKGPYPLLRVLVRRRRCAAAFGRGEERRRRQVVFWLGEAFSCRTQDSGPVRTKDQRSLCGDFRAHWPATVNQVTQKAVSERPPSRWIGCRRGGGHQPVAAATFATAITRVVLLAFEGLMSKDIVYYFFLVMLAHGR